MATVDHALYYARQGIAIIPVQPPRDGKCSCGGSCTLKNRSKHPLYELVPHGVSNATTDEETIRRWWEQWPDANIGGAMGKPSDGVVLADIDADDVGRLILEWAEQPENAGKYCIVRSATDDHAHVYFRVMGTLPKNRTLKAADGRRLGELRSTGLYGVLPPSQNVNGHFYGFSGLDDGELPPEVELPLVNDFDEGLQGLLDEFGVEIQTGRRQVIDAEYVVLGDESDDLDEGTWGTVELIEPKDLPIKFDGADKDSRYLRVWRTGAIDTQDRSGMILRGACSLIRLAHRRAYDIPRHTVAGVLKYLDAKLPEPKYANRADGDHQYLRAAKKAAQEVDKEERERTAVAGEQLALPAPHQSAHSGAVEPVSGDQTDGRRGKGAKAMPAQPSSNGKQPPREPRRGMEVLEEDGEEALGPSLLYVSDPSWGGGIRTGKSAIRQLTTFKPSVVRTIAVVDEDDPGDEPTVDYVLRLEQGEESLEVVVPRAAIKSAQAFRARLAPFLPAHFVVFPGAWEHIWPMASLTTAPTLITHQQQHARPGWHEEDGKAAFILPGAPAAIGPDGFEESIAFAGFRHKEPPKLMLYGKGVRPPESDDDYAAAEAAFLALLGAIEPEAAVPVLALCFAGPLTSQGMHEAPPLMNLVSKTNQFKSSYVYAALSIFGTFVRRGQRAGNPAPAEWGSTMTDLQRKTYTLRDLPVMIDDYKPKHVEKDMPGFIRFLQNYGDRSTRERMDTDINHRTTLTPAGLVISTGEQGWDMLEESIQSRTLTVPLVEHKLDSAAYAERKARIYALPQWVLAGYMQLIGGAYLRWLARLGLDTVQTQLIRLRDEELERMPQGIHARTQTTTASLFAAERFIAAFLKMEFPAIWNQWCDLQDQSDTAFIERIATDAVEAQALSPFRQVMEVINNRWGAHDIRFVARGSGGGSVIGDRLGKTVGFFDDGGIYLTEALTWVWYNQFGRDRKDSADFTWQGVRQDAVSTGHVTAKRIFGERNIRGLYLTREIEGVADILSEAPRHGFTDLVEIFGDGTTD